MTNIAKGLLVLLAISSFVAPYVHTYAQTEDEYHQTDNNLILVPANPSAGFNYPYYLLIPKSHSEFEKQYLVVETNNSGVSYDLALHTEKTRKAILGLGPRPNDRARLEYALANAGIPAKRDKQLGLHPCA